MRWAATRATGETWYPAAVKTLSTMHDPGVIRLLGVTTTRAANPEAARESSSYKHEISRLENYVSYVNEIANGIVWHHVQFAFLVPHLLAVTYHPRVETRIQCSRTICLQLLTLMLTSSPAIARPLLLSTRYHTRKSRLNIMRQIWQAVINLEDIVLERTPADQFTHLQKKLLQELLTTLAWNHGQLARESYKVCDEGNWDPFDEEIRDLAFALYARPLSTIYHLENVFNQLSTVVKRLRKNLVMNRHAAAA